MRFVLPMNTEAGNIGDNLNKLPGSKAKAWTLEDGKICVSPELLCDLGCETPRLNYPLYLGKKYRYFYAISSDVDLENPGTVSNQDRKINKFIHTKE
jgi:carotenoid isomerooxygenase